MKDIVKEQVKRWQEEGIDLGTIMDATTEALGILICAYRRNDGVCLLYDQGLKEPEALMRQLVKGIRVLEADTHRERHKVKREPGVKKKVRLRRVK